MRIRTQISMVLNLDKCIGCHTCSVTCKNIWTNRDGLNYAWFNNVETKPGLGFPKLWENQEKYKGGFVLNSNGKLELKQGSKLKLLANIFHNPNMPDLCSDYYEPYEFDYAQLQEARNLNTPKSLQPYSLITHKVMDKVESGPNWDDNLATEFSKRSADPLLEQVSKEMIGKFENTFMMYLPRLCEHCLNPACVASCPSGSIYKREDDGIVLVDQDKCRGYRMCVSGCPYKKIFFNYTTGKAEKCIFCYPRIESGEPTACSESCVGRIRYLGVMLYDADKIEEFAATKNVQDLYAKQLDIFLDPNDENVIKEAQAQGIEPQWLEASKRSPIYKLIKEYKLAFPLHPEYRTLPMVWYVPPLSPITKVLEEKVDGLSYIPSVEDLKIPLRYLANMLSAGDEKPIKTALNTMIALRRYMRNKEVGDIKFDNTTNFSVQDFDDMYKLLAIADYKDRFVIPTKQIHNAKAAYDESGYYGFKFANNKKSTLFTKANNPIKFTRI